MGTWGEGLYDNEVLKEWRRNLDRLYGETPDQRDFCDDYVSRARRGLRMLKASRPHGDQ
jgi:hypothetical protein